MKLSISLKLSIYFIRPDRTDIQTQLDMMKPSFDGLGNPKAEFQSMVDNVKSNQAGLYHIKGKGVNLRFVGMDLGEGVYFVSALAGKGLAHGLPYFIDLVSARGFHTLKGQAVRRGMVRNYERAGFTALERNGVTELTLSLGGDHGRR